MRSIQNAGADKLFGSVVAIAAQNASCSDIVYVKVIQPAADAATPAPLLISSDKGSAAGVYLGSVRSDIAAVGQPIFAGFVAVPAVLNVSWSEQVCAKVKRAAAGASCERK